MGLTRTTADAALKEDYEPGIRSQINDSNVILAQVEKGDVDQEGRRAVLSLHVGRNVGTGARAEGGTLPTAGNQQYAEQRVPLYYNYGRIQITGPVMRAMKSDSASFTRAVDSETKGIVADLKRDYNRQIFGTSNGVVAQCGTTNTATEIVLASDTPLSVMRQFEIGRVVDIGTVANPVAIANSVSITAVNRSTKTITVSGSNVSTTGSHYVFWEDAGGAIGGVGQKEITGLRSIVDSSGALHNVDPSTVPVWAATEDANGGTNRAPSDTLFERVLDTVEIESGEMPNLIVTTHGIVRSYANGLKDQKRFSNTLDLKGGFKAVSVATASGELGMVSDRDCPAETAFLLNTSHLFHHVGSDWEFMDEDGAVLNRVADKDAYEATLFKYSELTTDQRNSHAKIVDLSGDNE